MNAFFDLPTALLSTLIPLDDQVQHGQYEVDKLNTMYGQTDTFLKLLLRIETVQETAIEMLLGKMLLLIGEDVGENGTPDQGQGQSEHERLATQIFNHIRWCELLVSPERVVKTCLESLLVAMI